MASLWASICSARWRVSCAIALEIAGRCGSCPAICPRRGPGSSPCRLKVMDWLLAMTTNPSERAARSVTALDVCRRSLRAAARALAIALASEDNARAEARQVQGDLAEAMRRQEEFVAVMVHDALTDLTVIKGWAQLLQRRLWGHRTAETAALAAMAAKIDQQATRLAAQIRLLEVPQAQEASQDENDDPRP